MMNRLMLLNKTESDAGVTDDDGQINAVEQDKSPMQELQTMMDRLMLLNKTESDAGVTDDDEQTNDVEQDRVRCMSYRG